MPQWPSFCQAGLATYAEQPEPARDQADSAQPRVVLADRVSVVPPTASTVDSDAGQAACWKPLSPLDTVTATPGCRKFALYAWFCVPSSEPQLLETATAPEPVAAFSAVPRAAVEASSDSTRRMWH